MDRMHINLCGPYHPPQIHTHTWVGYIWVQLCTYTKLVPTNALKKYRHTGRMQINLSGPSEPMRCQPSAKRAARRWGFLVQPCPCHQHQQYSSIHSALPRSESICLEIGTKSGKLLIHRVCKMSHDNIYPPKQKNACGTHSSLLYVHYFVSIFSVGYFVFGI